MTDQRDTTQSTDAVAVTAGDAAGTGADQAASGMHVAQTGNVFGRYLVVSIASAIVNVSLTSLLHEVCGLTEELAFLLALATVFVVNFLGLRHYAFSAAKGSLHKQLLRYLSSMITIRIGEYLGFLLLHSVLAFNYVPAIFLVLACSWLVKHFVHRRLVFRSTQSQTGTAQ